MIVLESKKALIIKARYPDRITTVIPTAKTFEFRGDTLVAVPHKLEETKVLQNLGFDAPSPIKYHYDFPGRYTPFYAQKETAAFLSMYGRAFCLNGMGSGKTLATLWAYDYLRSKKLVNKLLVVSPLSTMETTWGEEIFYNFPHLTYTVLHGSRKQREMLLDSDADIFIINHHGLSIVAEKLSPRKDIDLVVIDEVAQVGRNSGTDIWKSLNTVCNKQLNGSRKVWGLTGTPTPNSPTDAWGQCRLVLPGSVTPSFKMFRETTMAQIGNFKWAPKANATEIIHKVMQPAIRFSREQCVDLPPCMYSTRTVELTTEQKKAYKFMAATLVAEVNDNKIQAVNEAVKLSKLVQIACGVALGKDGEEVALPAIPRMKEVVSIIEEAASKVIVFVPFRASITVLAEFIQKAGYDVACVHGSVAAADREAIFSAFQRAENPRVIVAQPAAMSHGLTLTAANTIVWYAPVTSAEVYEQANARVSRPGQKLSQFIINLEGTTVERKIYQRLKEKQALQGLLLSMAEEKIDGKLETV